MIMPKRRLRSCVENWPDAETGWYDPRCCRFPKSCSATVYGDEMPEEMLEPAPKLLRGWSPCTSANGYCRLKHGHRGECAPSTDDPALTARAAGPDLHDAHQALHNALVSLGSVRYRITGRSIHDPLPPLEHAVEQVRRAIDALGVDAPPD